MLYKLTNMKAKGFLCKAKRELVMACNSYSTSQKTERNAITHPQSLPILVLNIFGWDCNGFPLASMLFNKKI